MTEDIDESFSNQSSISEFIDSISGFGRVTKVKLQNAGYETVGDLRKSDESDLCEIDQIGPGTAKSILGIVTEDENRSDKSSISDCELNEEIPLEKWAEKVPKLGRVKRVHLKRSGYETVGDLRRADKDDLTDVQMIGSTVAQKILDSVDDQSSQKDRVSHNETNPNSQENKKEEDLDTVEAILRDLDLEDEQ